MGPPPRFPARRREVLLDGLRRGLPTGLSIGLCFMAGPLGLLCHVITGFVHAARRGEERAADSDPEGCL